MPASDLESHGHDQWSGGRWGVNSHGLSQFRACYLSSENLFNTCRLFLKPRRIFLLTSFVLILLIMMNWTSSPPPPSAVLENGVTMVKPDNFKIIGLLFFGRQSTVEILECYLRNNLVSHGGFLDEVHFVVNTHDEGDLAWLSKVVYKVKDYKKIDIDDGDGIQDFNRIYAQSVERDRMYIKLDDDLVRSLIIMVKQC